MRDAKSAAARAATRSAAGAAARLAAPLAALGLPLPLARPPGGDPHDDPFAPLLLADAARASTTAGGALRARLLGRVAASAAASRTVHTRRHADTVAQAVAEGVTTRELYRGGHAVARRPGEPEGVLLVELAPHARWVPGHENADAAAQQEWLVLRGHVMLGDTPLGAHDYHVRPAGVADTLRALADGALLVLRTARHDTDSAPFTQRAEGAQWHDYAPGIRRRLMWQQGTQAAMLYHAQPGAAVPHHGHGHDEQCLMLAGDFFLDEVLLRPLDYQLAPAGSEHHVSCTDTGVVIYAHGDIDLALK